MIEEKILEGNKLIAEFMGLSYCDKYQYEGWYQNNEYNYRICDFNSLKYHSSWDWLIPAVEKIEHTMYVNIKGCHVTISSIVNVSKSTKIEAVWIAAVAFIKWYN